MNRLSPPSGKFWIFFENSRSWNVLENILESHAFLVVQMENKQQ